MQQGLGQDLNGVATPRAAGITLPNATASIGLVQEGPPVDEAHADCPAGGGSRRKVAPGVAQVARAVGAGQAPEGVHLPAAPPAAALEQLGPAP